MRDSLFNTDADARTLLIGTIALIAISVFAVVGNSKHASHEGSRAEMIGSDASHGVTR